MATTTLSCDMKNGIKESRVVKIKIKVKKTIIRHLFNYNSIQSYLLILNSLLPSLLTVLGDTRTGNMVPCVVKSLRNKVPSFTDSREDSDRGRDSTITFTPWVN